MGKTKTSDEAEMGQNDEEDSEDETKPTAEDVDSEKEPDPSAELAIRRMSPTHLL